MTQLRPQCSSTENQVENSFPTSDLEAWEKCSEAAEITAHEERIPRVHTAWIPLPVLGFPLLTDSQTPNTLQQYSNSGYENTGGI